MLRLIIIALLLYGAYYLAHSLLGEYKDVQRRNGAEEVPAATRSAAPAPAAPIELTGMPSQLQPSLDTAEAQGPLSLKRWLESHRAYVHDPKLGDIELDYAVAAMRQNSAEARAAFQAVKQRTPSDSPLQPRLKRLAKTFE